MNESVFSRLSAIAAGDRKALARAISLVENQQSGFTDLLQTLPPPSKPLIGITGPPGAGKSTLVNALTKTLTDDGKKLGILCIDPSSPFHHGALLGDRVRLQQWYDHPGVYVRSLSTRGSLGGLHPRLFEIADLMQAADFDYIIIETVGTGQTEMDIARLADLTVLVLMPGAGDEVQAMKSGIMEIADLFVLNKSDHPDSQRFQLQLRSALAMEKKRRDIFPTIATENLGISELIAAINKMLETGDKEKKKLMLTEKAFRLILAEKMRSIDRATLSMALEKYNGDVNLYQFISSWLKDIDR